MRFLLVIFSISIFSMMLPAFGDLNSDVIVDGLNNPWIWDILEDKTGNIWVGTRENGLYFFDGKTFINYTEYKNQLGTE